MLGHSCTPALPFYGIWLLARQDAEAFGLAFRGDLPVERRMRPFMSALLQPDSDRFTGLGARPPVSVPDQFELQRLQRWLCHGSFRRAFYRGLGALHAPVGGKCSTVTLYVRETGGSSLLQAPWDCLNGPRGSSTYSPYMQREHARSLALAPPRGKCIEVRTLSRRDYGGQIVLAGPGSGQIRRPPPIEVG